MKKLNKLFLLFTMFSIVLLLSLNLNIVYSNDNISNYLPDETLFYVNVNNVEELSNKIKYEELKKYLIAKYGDFTKDIISLFDRDLSDIQVWKEIGIDTKKSFGIAYHDFRDNIASVILNISNQTRFTSFLTNLLKKNQIKTESMSYNGKNLYKIYSDPTIDKPDLVIILDDAKAIFVFSAKEKSKRVLSWAKSLIDDTEGKNLASLDKLKKLENEIKVTDISIYMDTKNIFKSSNDLDSIDPDIENMLKNISDFEALYGGLTFEQNRVACSFSATVKKDSKLWSKKENSLTKESLKAFDDVPLLLIRNATNWKEIYNRLKEEFGNNPMLIGMISEIESNFQKTFDIEINKALDALSGDFNLALFSLPNMMGLGTDICILNRIKNYDTVSSIWKRCIGLLEKNEVQVIEKKYKNVPYYSTALVMFNPTLAITNDYLISCMTERRMQSIIDNLYADSGSKGFINKITNEEIKNAILESESILWIDVKRFTKEITNNFPDPNVEMMSNLLSPISDFYFAGNDDINKELMKFNIVFIGENDLFFKLVKNILNT